jgi:hypothetical protein
MKVEQQIWTAGKQWEGDQKPKLGDSAQLVLAFGATSVMNEPGRFKELRAAYPQAHICGCSTAGEIRGTSVTDDSLVATAVHFEHSNLKMVKVALDQTTSSVDAGEKLAKLLPQDGLVHVFVICDGLKVNGTELVQGLVKNLPATVAVTGGLSGDGARFQQTLVYSDAQPVSGIVTAIGFYGSRLNVCYGSMGGWDPFGPERVVTKSKGNVLYELDGQSALALYKKYLGEHAAGLPASGLLFPLSLRYKESNSTVVRTILSVDEKDQSMTFAGDLPQGSYARLMKANFDRLIEGASSAAQSCMKTIGADSPDLAVLISCVGRKLVLKQRIEEEVEAVSEKLGSHSALAGFYSYGEISPFTSCGKCELHNQTMTITTFSER